MQKRWQQAFRLSVRGRGLRFVSEEAFVVDDVYITSLTPSVRAPAGEHIEVGWSAAVKPLAVDDVLWAAFMPEEEMSPGTRLNRRINGAFQIVPLEIARGSFEAPIADDPGPHWDVLLAAFGRIRTDFTAGHPRIDDYLSAIRAADLPARPVFRQREIATLIAAGHVAEAAGLAEAALGAGERGTMSSDADVFEYLAAYAQGPEAWQALRRSLVPTHDLLVVSEVTPRRAMGLSRLRHPGRFGAHLAQLDGTDIWAVTLTTRPTAGVPPDAAAVRYLQAAGSADAMVVEIRQPGGDDWGAVSVRCVIGDAGRAAGPDARIRLPRSVERLSRHEVFTAGEATALFEHYYRTGRIPEHHTLRCVEGWDAQGHPITPA